MHEQDVNTEIFNTQADNVVNTTLATDMRQLSFDIESFTSDATILIDTIFETIDGLVAVPATLQRPVNAINCFATCVKRHLVLITEANDKLRHIASGEVKQ
jgi:hypothetical protein